MVSKYTWFDDCMVFPQQVNEVESRMDARAHLSAAAACITGPDTEDQSVHVQLYEVIHGFSRAQWLVFRRDHAVERPERETFLTSIEATSTAAVQRWLDIASEFARKHSIDVTASTRAGTQAAWPGQASAESTLDKQRSTVYSTSHSSGLIPTSLEELLELPAPCDQIFSYLSTSTVGALRVASSACLAAVASHAWTDTTVVIKDAARWHKCFPAARAGALSKYGLTTFQHRMFSGVSWLQGLGETINRVAKNIRPYESTLTPSPMESALAGTCMDSAVSHLKDLRSLRLCYWPRINGATFPMRNLHTLDISNCQSIEIEAFAHLGKVHTLNLSRCECVTDQCLSYLNGVHTLTLVGCPLITDAGVAHLKNVHTLDISRSGSVHGTSFAHLHCLKSLLMNYCCNVTDDAFKHLTGLEKLSMVRCTRITDAAFQHLLSRHSATGAEKNTCLRHLLLTECSQDELTGVWLKSFPCLEELHVTSCNNVLIIAAVALCQTAPKLLCTVHRAVVASFVDPEERRVVAPLIQVWECNRGDIEVTKRVFDVLLDINSSFPAAEMESSGLARMLIEAALQHFEEQVLLHGVVWILTQLVESREHAEYFLRAGILRLFVTALSCSVQVCNELMLTMLRQLFALLYDNMASCAEFSKLGGPQHVVRMYSSFVRAEEITREEEYHCLCNLLCLLAEREQGPVLQELGVAELLVKVITADPVPERKVSALACSTLANLTADLWPCFAAQFDTITVVRHWCTMLNESNCASLLVLMVDQLCSMLATNPVVLKIVSNTACALVDVLEDAPFERGLHENVCKLLLALGPKHPSLSKLLVGDRVKILTNAIRQHIKCEGWIRGACELLSRLMEMLFKSVLRTDCYHAPSAMLDVIRQYPQDESIVLCACAASANSGHTCGAASSQLKACMDALFSHLSSEVVVVAMCGALTPYCTHSPSIPRNPIVKDAAKLPLLLDALKVHMTSRRAVAAILKVLASLVHAAPLLDARLASPVWKEVRTAYPNDVKVYALLEGIPSSVSR